MKFSLKVIEEELLLDFIDNREKLRDDAKIKIQKVQKENQQGFNKKRKRPTVYQVGGLVAIKDTQFSKVLLVCTIFWAVYTDEVIRKRSV